jgi:nucleoside-diphosphate-sugar epimerase
MSILLTGASGFIGNEVLKKIKKSNITVKTVPSRIFSTPSFNNINQNKRLPKLFSGISTIIHCGGLKPTHSNFYEDYKKINVDLTLNLAKQAVFYNVKRFIFISSLSVNGSKNINNKSFKYSDIAVPKDPYAISKLQAEIGLQKISKQTGLKIVIIRPSLVYGKKVEGNFLSLLKIIYKQIPLPIKNLKYLKAYVGIDNLVDVIIRCVNYPNLSGKTLLVSDGQDISFLDLVKKISKIMNKSLILFPIPNLILKIILKSIGKDEYCEKLFNSSKVDISYTRKMLQWSPRFSLDDQLKKTVDWYLKNQ